MADAQTQESVAMAQPPAAGSNGPTNKPETSSANTTALPPAPAPATRFRFPPGRPLSRTELNAQSPLPSPRLQSRRRSSLISYSSLEDVTQSFHDDFISPRTSDARPKDDEDALSHWHSTPLAFAILPALGGLFFNNGSAFVTDILLLGLAAIFLNWSIRLPWDWYYSAQTLRKEVTLSSEEAIVDDDLPDTIPEEDNREDVAVETASSIGGSPRPHSRRREPSANIETTPEDSTTREEAAASLRRQETLALVATFLFPVLAAYLLHVIRAQLSRPSTNLVSDYNLSIFLLAAEIRPCRQVIRLLSSRTLHLQRQASGLDEPFAAADTAKSLQSDLAARITALESQLAAHTLVPPTVSLAQKADVTDLSAELRKRYEPRLDGLERAVRRYEKRSTTLALAVETRLHALETRLQEALSLTAAVAQQNQRTPARVVATKVADGVGKMVVTPFKAAAWLATLPFAVADTLYARFKAIMLGPVPPKPALRKKPNGFGEKGLGPNGLHDRAMREKLLARKMVR